MLSKRVGANTEWAESLHTEIVNETIFLDEFHILQYLIGRNFVINKSQCHRESIAPELSKIEHVENALKRAAFQFSVPIFALLYLDKFLWIATT